MIKRRSLLLSWLPVLMPNREFLSNVPRPRFDLGKRVYAEFETEDRTIYYIGQITGLAYNPLPVG